MSVMVYHCEFCHFVGGPTRWYDDPYRKKGRIICPMCKRPKNLFRAKINYLDKQKEAKNVRKV